MFGAAIKFAGGESPVIDGQAYLRATNVTNNASQILIPAETQPNDLIIYIERSANPVSIVADFTMLVSVSSAAAGRGASISYKVAATSDTSRTLGGQTFGQKLLFVVYSDVPNAIYTPISSNGQITNSTPTTQTLNTTSVSGAPVLLAVYAQTGGTSATRTFNGPTSITTMFSNIGGMEGRLALNTKTTCTIAMTDEGNANTMLSCSFLISED